MPALTLSALTVYPIKSAGGIPVTEWDVDGFGLRHDRRWMVVDPRGRMVTQRTCPRLALVRPTFEGRALVVRVRGRAPLTLPLEPAETVSTGVTIWDVTCAALWQGEAAGCWFSDVLGSKVDLVYMPDSTRRPVDPATGAPGARVSFADAFPFLLLSEESLADLNRRMPTPLPMNRFRPNLVIRGGAPFAEDGLGVFAIGGIPFRAVKPCDRCVVTTIDQETGEPGSEPLRTLGTYRRAGGKVYFGQNLIHLNSGVLSVGKVVRT